LNNNHEVQGEKQKLSSIRHVKWPTWPSKKKTASHPEQKQLAEKQPQIDDQENQISPAFDEQDPESSSESIHPFHHEEDDLHSVEIDPFHINNDDRPYDPPHSE